jgi:hypothetical protein
MTVRLSCSTLLMVALCVSGHISGGSTALTAREEREILAQIDMICRCTRLLRKSGVQKVERFNTAERGYGITVMLAADGASEKYWCRFTGDRHITEFAPSGGQMRWELPPVQSAPERALCLEAIKRLDHCDVAWAHYGKPTIGRDSSTRYRVTYKSIPEKELVGSISLLTNIYFLVTRKGTLCGVWAGE